MTITKKIILIISVILFAIPTYAVDMCASDNAVVVVLDSNIGGTSRLSDAPTSIWRVSFPYGTITGISSCLGYGSASSSVVNDGTVFGGEQNGSMCWCKMTHPAVSKWICVNRYYGNGQGTWGSTDVSACARSCTEACGSFIQSNSGTRIQLFSSVTN